MRFFLHCPNEPYLLLPAVTYFSKGLFQGSHLLAVMSSKKRQLIYGSSVNAPVRHKCLSAIGKLFYFSSMSMIQSLLGATNVSRYITYILMEKLPETFSKLFVREGVVHAVLIVPESSVQDTDLTPGSSVRSKRNQHHTLNTDATTAEDSKNTPSNYVEAHVVNYSLWMVVSTIAFKDDHKSKSKGKSKASSPRVVNFSPTKEDDLLKLVIEMLAEVSKGDGVSTFKFIGISDALLNYLSCGCFYKKRVSEDNLPKLRQQALKRYKSSTTVPLPYGLAHGGMSLCDYSSNILLIDPLASLPIVEDFLWPHVQRNESSHTSMKYVNDESMSEEEDVEISPIEVNDALVIKDDGVSEDDDDEQDDVCL
ncbi:hypothetical protein Tco_0477247 [Tanacetum coccineum]